MGVDVMIELTVFAGQGSRLKIIDAQTTVKEAFFGDGCSILRLVKSRPRVFRELEAAHQQPKEDGQKPSFQTAVMVHSFFPTLP
jgi:hypothetical protein